MTATPCFFGRGTGGALSSGRFAVEHGMHGERDGPSMAPHDRGRVTMLPDNEIKEILQRAHTIAVVGLSDRPDRDSNGVARFLQRNGYRIIPVNPNLRG